MSTQVTVSVLPDCDIHKHATPSVIHPAAYDGKTVMGPWGYMCEDAFASVGVGLGTGRGQRLVLDAPREADGYGTDPSADDPRGGGRTS